MRHSSRVVRTTGGGNRPAYDYLIAATRATLAGQLEAIVTAPISKAALHLAGLNYPGTRKFWPRPAASPTLP